MPPHDARWTQFRRLLLGTVIEALLRAQVRVIFESIHIHFTDESDFRVPRLNNYMRFQGAVEARLAQPLAPAQADHLRHLLQQAWPDILSVVDLPVGDRLTHERNEITIQIQDDQRLHIAFDLEAD